MVKRIDKYELRKTLGKGTFSKVKYAVDTTTNQQFAIKIVDRKMVKKENLETQLKREIAIMKLLKHEHICGLREVLQSMKHIYIVLELITGGELFDRIVKAKRFSEDIARGYFQQIITGIAYCHEQGIAHRDLKPENLLLDENNHIKISDFGLSSLTEAGEEEMLTTTCGTPNYVAPEVLQEKGYSGYTADIWSCGVILYVMLAGYLPFEEKTMSALFNKIEKGAFSFPKHFSDSSKDLISKMLIVDPKKRITIKNVMKHKWFKKNFDSSFIRKKKKIKLTQDQMNSSIIKTKEATKKVEKEEKPKTGMNAFELLGKLMEGTMNPLMGMDVKIRRETRCMLSGTKKIVIPLIEKTLSKMKVTHNMKKGELKCFITTDGYILTFNIEVVETKAGFCLVEVRRGKGDILKFNEIFRSFVQELGDKVIKKESENVNE